MSPDKKEILAGATILTMLIVVYCAAYSYTIMKTSKLYQQVHHDYISDF